MAGDANFQPLFFGGVSNCISAHNECEEYSAGHCQSRKTLLWILMML